MVSRIADTAVVCQQYAARPADGLENACVYPVRDPLVTLAVIIGADIEQLMILPVIPADDLTVAFGAFRFLVDFSARVFSALEHRQEPAPRCNRMRLQEFQRRFIVHLRRHDAFEIHLQRQFVDCRDPAVGGGQERQIALKCLFFFLFPVEVDADRYRMQRKSRASFGDEANLFPL